MATLDASSSLAEVRAAYADAASFEEDASPAKARSFITACRLLLALLPKRSAHGDRGSNEVELDLTVLERQLVEARRWLAAQGHTGAFGRVVHADLSNFRG